MSRKLLIVDDDFEYLKGCAEVCSTKLKPKIQGFKVVTATTIDQAVNLIQKDNEIEVALIDYKLNGDNGIDLMIVIKEINPSIYSKGPRCHLESKGHKSNRSDNRRNRDGKRTGSQGASQSWGNKARYLCRYVLLLLTITFGMGARRQVKSNKNMNCRAIVVTLAESELFGHVKGAFADAIKDRRGAFEVADGGTLFLDEIDSAPLEIQGKLLRAIQEKAFYRVGDSETFTESDCRIITATNQDLKNLIAMGLFRQDLYYRISITSIHIPPLREHREDIPLLANHFLQTKCLVDFTELPACACRTQTGRNWLCLFF